MGGMVGIIFSYTGSWVINHVLKIGDWMTGVAGDISLIPLWLSLSSVTFSVVVGMLAGLFPALRAMRLSPPAAIRE